MRSLISNPLPSISSFWRTSIASVRSLVFLQKREKNLSPQMKGILCNSSSIFVSPLQCSQALRKWVLQHFSKKPSHWQPLLTAVNGCQWAGRPRGWKEGSQNYSNSTAAFFRTQSFLMLERRSLRNWRTALWKQWRGWTDEGHRTEAHMTQSYYSRSCKAFIRNLVIWERLKQENGKGRKGRLMVVVDWTHPHACSGVGH